MKTNIYSIWSKVSWERISYTIRIISLFISSKFPSHFNLKKFIRSLLIHIETKNGFSCIESSYTIWPYLSFSIFLSSLLFWFDFIRLNFFLWFQRDPIKITLLLLKLSKWICFLLYATCLLIFFNVKINVFKIFRSILISSFFSLFLFYQVNFVSLVNSFILIVFSFFALICSPYLLENKKVLSFSIMLFDINSFPSFLFNIYFF